MSSNLGIRIDRSGNLVAGDLNNPDDCVQVSVTFRTVRDVLAQAYPVQIDRIVELAEATEASLLDEPAYDTPGALLASSFLFAKTEEGCAYWAELAKREGWRDAVK